MSSDNSVIREPIAEDRVRGSVFVLALRGCKKGVWLVRGL